MKNLIRLFSFVIILAATGCEAQESPKAQISEFKLSNGMNVVVVENHIVPAVTHMVWYHVGAADDPKDKSGLAHFLEHMMFKGTDKFPDFSRNVEKIGGQSNAFTSSDYTAYFQIVAKEYLPLMMDMESDRMSNLKLLPEQITSENKVILEERQMRFDNNISGYIEEKTNAAIFGNHPYHIPIIGYESEIKNLSVQDVQDFYKRIYHPANAFLLVAGDITVAEVKALAEKFYGHIPSGTEYKRNWPDEPEPKTKSTLALSHPLARTPIWRQVFVAPSYTTEKGSEYADAMNVIEYILGADKTGWVYRDLVDGKKLASSINVDYSPAVGPSLFSIAVSPIDGADLDEIAAVINSNIKKITTDGVSTEELQLAKDAMTAWRTYQLEGIRSMAFTLGRMLVSGRSIDDYINYEERIRAITPETIKAAAQYVLKPDTALTVTMHPVEEKK